MERAGSNEEPAQSIRSLIESGIGAFSYSSKSATGTTGTSFMVIRFHLIPPLWQTASTEAKDSPTEECPSFRAEVKKLSFDKRKHRGRMELYFT